MLCAENELSKIDDQQLSMNDKHCDSGNALSMGNMSITVLTPI